MNRPAWVGVVLCSCAVVGCATNVYRPTNLPLEYTAPEPEDLTALDFSRLVHRTVASDYVDCGDVLKVMVWSDVDSNPQPQLVRVNDDGTANVGLIGPVPVAGLRLPEIEQRIARAAVERDVYRRPHVTVQIEEERKNRITVAGAVKEPGVYELPRGESNLLRVLVEAGGLDTSAGPIIEIRRPSVSGRKNSIFLGPDREPYTAGLGGDTSVQQASLETTGDGPQTVQVNLVSLATEGRTHYELQDGDVVMVTKRDQQPIYVDGLVNSPGAYRTDPNKETRLTDAIALAGGLSSPLADTVWVVRRTDEDENSIVIKCSIRKARQDRIHNILLKPGDTITVKDTPITFVYDSFIKMFRIGSSVTLF
ncbi:MAG: hypothetical protein D6741_10410 [Planctomycetota bacterium]|nr:MAG: hypothetical protein D6741_10410 [Planctomycetota bacterium]